RSRRAAEMHQYLADKDFTVAEAAFLVTLFEFQEYPLEPKPRKHILDMIQGVHEACHDMLVGDHETPAPFPPNLQRLYSRVSRLSTVSAEGVRAYCMGWWASRRQPEPVPAAE